MAGRGIDPEEEATLVPVEEYRERILSSVRELLLIREVAT